MTPAGAQEYTVNIVSRDNNAIGVYNVSTCDVIVLTPVAGSDYGTSAGRQMYSVTFPVGSQSQSFLLTLYQIQCMSLTKHSV